MSKNSTTSKPADDAILSLLLRGEGEAVPNPGNFALGKIITVPILQEIQDKFSEATGLAAIIVDADGKPVTVPSNFTKFCNYIRSSSRGVQACMDCDNRSGRKAMERQGPHVYKCHSGMMDLAAPVIVRGEYLGAFLAGQVRVAQEIDSVEEMRRKCADLDLDLEILASLFDKIPVVPKLRLKAAADLIYIMSNYIVEMSLADIVQKQLIDEMKAKADLENMLRAAELKALQSQVNPHFLFNTLNTIARLALLEGAEQTQEVAFALSDLLRNNLRDSDQPSTLGEEISSIKDYFLIQQVRFGDRMHVFINIPDDLLEIQTPGMTLQPLVENAIIHGLEPKRDGGSVTINAAAQDGIVTITVADSGVGIASGRIREIFLEEKRAVSRGQTTGLGIVNVHKRIQHYFGQEYGVRVDSQPGEGTTVHVRLPESRRNKCRQGE